MENKELVIKLYNNGMSMAAIAKKLSRSRQYVKTRLKNIPVRSCTEQNRKYITDDYYFDDINNQNKAYWLGFILADGCVYRDYLAICLSNKDIKHLKKFRDEISPNRPIYNQPGKIYLQIKSKILVKSLSNYGVVPNKTKLVSKIPNIPEEFLNSFVRGYFDADGTICKDKDKRFKSIQLRFSIYGNQPFLEEVNELINTEVGLSKTKVSYGTDIFYLRKSGNKNLVKLYKWLYKNADTYLERKHTIFKEIVP